MNKLSIYFLIVILFLVSAYAINQQVVILKMDYDKGNISLLNKSIKYGFLPDRRYQPEYGYKVEIISFDNKILEDFRFKVPNVLYVDSTALSGELDGGKIILDKTEFALIFPYYPEMKEVKIYNSNDELISKSDISDKKKVNSGLLIFGIVGLIVLGFVIIYPVIRRKKKKKK
jgi:hypothetical protein